MTFIYYLASMIYEIKIGTSFSKTRWCTFINENRISNIGKSIKELIIDFSECKFIEPFHVVALACLLEEYHLSDVKISFINCDKLELKEYLSDINFFEYWTSSFDRNTYTSTNRTTNLCLWKLESTMLSEYVLRAQKYFEDNYLASKSVEPLNISLAETFNNIIDHSDSLVSGYCISQFYPNLNKIKIAVCDFGKGIPYVVNKYLKESGFHELKDDNAIIKALEKTFSTKTTPKNKGYGLDNVKNIALSCNGLLRIVSNKGVYILRNNEINSFVMKSSFQGTHIEIILDTTKFDRKEDDYITDDFEF